MKRHAVTIVLAVVATLGASCEIQQDLTPIIESRPQAQPLPSATPTPTPSPTPRPTPTPTDDPSATESPSEEPTDDPSASPSPSATPTPRATPTPTPKPTASATPKPSPSPSPTPIRTTSPSPTPSPTGSSSNNAPVTGDDQASTVEGQTITIDVLANDRDPDGDKLSIDWVGVPEPDGFAEIVNGRIRFTAKQGTTGQVSFPYGASDGTATTRGTIRVQVARANRAPVAGNDSFGAKACGTFTWTLTGNDSDPDGDTISLDTVSSPAHGSVSIASATQVRYTAPCGATAPPPPNDSFTYTVRDTSGARSGSATVSITVN